MKTLSRKSQTNNNQSRGFTIVEAVVTIVVVSIFIGFIFQMYLVAESQRIAVSRRATASDIAYSNLDKVTSKAQLATDLCSASNDLTVTADATGSNLIRRPDGGSIDPETISANLGPNVSQQLLVTYPRGCGPNMPARITSIVSYGNPSESVVHVSFVN